MELCMIYKVRVQVILHSNAHNFAHTPKFTEASPLSPLKCFPGTPKDPFQSENEPELKGGGMSASEISADTYDLFDPLVVLRLLQ